MSPTDNSTSNAWPTGQGYTIQPHGSGHALYRGRDRAHHGLNLAQISEASEETLQLIERAMNANVSSPGGPRVLLELSLDQADTLAKAALLYARLGIGQFEALATLVEDGIIPINAESSDSAVPAPNRTCHLVRHVLASVKSVMGFDRNASRGIGHPHNHISVARAYEVSSAISQSLTEHREPGGAGNKSSQLMRYTQDLAANVRIA